MTATSEQDQRYQSAATAHGAALERLARGYEANPERRRDLVQDIHVALWRSFALFDDRCSLRTWTYRVAHNTATSYILKQQRAHAGQWVGLDDDLPMGGPDLDDTLHQQQALSRLTALIQRLKPQDRQIILLYLEDVEASAMAEITGLKAGHIATKISRIKALLRLQFHQANTSTGRRP